MISVHPFRWWLVPLTTFPAARNPDRPNWPTSMPTAEHGWGVLGTQLLTTVAYCNPSDPPGPPQVCEGQLEVTLVEHLCACFPAVRRSDPVQLAFVPLQR